MNHITWGVLLTLSVLNLSCSDLGGGGNGDSVDKTYGSYYDDPNNDSYSVSDPTFEGDTGSWYSSEEEAYIDELLNAWLGDPEEGDLSDGSVLVAGPGASGPEVILSCSQGTVAVTAGVAVGALATALAGSGVALAGVGASATIPASAPLYAVAGGLIGFGLSGDAWGNCLLGLARLCWGLMTNGYASAARGVQSVVRANRSSGAFARPTAPSRTAECRPNGRHCDNMTGRYHADFCDRVDPTRDFLGIDVHTTGVCDLGGLGCNELSELIRLSAGCWLGRQAVTDRCYDGSADEGHRKAMEYAKRDYNSCLNAFVRGGCGDRSIGDEFQSQARQAFPECR